MELKHATWNQAFRSYEQNRNCYRGIQRFGPCNGGRVGLCWGKSRHHQQKSKTKAIAISATVTSEEEIQKAVATTIKELGSIDILINNAGINIRGPIDELSYEDFKKVQQTNVDGTWLPSKAVVPQMKKQKSGRIINLASTLGVVGLANRTPYATSKGAVVLMTRALALELAPFNITVNAICPGPFLTDMNIPIKDDENTKKFIIGAVALERWGELKEIQGAALYLASAASSYTTGSLITVDGGWTAR